MPLVIVKFPRESGKKVNMSKFLSKFKSIESSRVVDIPDDELPHALDVLSRNKCKVTIAKHANEDLEKQLLQRISRLCEKIKEGRAKPKELEELAVNAIAQFSLENLSQELSELLHSSIEFGENPTILILNDIERESKELLHSRE